jgi:CRP/FNR family transcriptional regulator, anaerobic regulatory protein
MSEIAFRSEALAVTGVAAASSRSLRPTEILFQTGDAKTCLYRVESGAVVLYERQWNESNGANEFALPGDLVGLGFLEFHTCCACAVAETQLTCLPLEAQASLTANNPKARAKLADATEREFEFSRALAVQSGERSALTRVAAFLVSVSRINSHEGRDPQVVSESCPSGFVADLLGISVETLATVLAELRHQGLVEATGRGRLRLIDIRGLEKLTGQRVMHDPVKCARSQALNPELTAREAA